MRDRLARVHENPDWPALMDTPTAAAYVSMSEPSLRFVARRRGVNPVDCGLSLVRWRRRDLDALIDALPARGETIPAEPGLTESDPAEEALERAKRRARK